MDERRFWRRFTFKILFIIMFVVITLSVSLYAMMNRQYHITTIDALKDDAEIVHEYVDKVLDHESFDALNTIEDENSEMYINAHRQLDEIRRIANIRYLYTAKQNAEGEYVYVLDGLDPLSEDFRHIGDPIEEEILPKLKQCLNGESILDEDIQVTEWGIVYVTYFPVYGTDGSVVGAIGMEFDCEHLYKSLDHMRIVTALIALLLAAAFSSVAMIILKKTVKRAEVKLTEKDRLLISAKEEALKSNKAKSVFLSHISHEIRTPLNAIIGMAGILKDTKDDKEKTLFSIDQILLSSNHLLSILNNVLDITKIESGKLELSYAPFSLKDICDEVSRIIRPQCGGKSIVYTDNVGEMKDIMLIGDKLRISQVLINLLSNAVKFTLEGGKVDFNVQTFEEANNMLRCGFKITDNGIGMSEEQLLKLFIPFEQTKANVAARYGGAGLGLSISQNLVNIMGGRIEVESQLNAGTIFSFELTFEISGKSVNDADITSSDVDFRGKRILLAEDIEINRIVVCETLAGTGLEIEEALDGKEAAEAFDGKPADYYDLILMDIQMPVMNGYEAARTIRSLGRPDAKTIPIVAMTANAYKEDRDEAIASGMNAHLPKPIDVGLLINTLADFFDKNKNVSDC